MTTTIPNRTTTTAEQIADRLQRTITGPMWHGPAINDLLLDVGPREAARRPIARAHSIWEIVLHLTTWAEIAIERVRGRGLEDPPSARDWPSLPVGRDSTAWAQAQSQLADTYERLAAAVRVLEEEALQRVVPKRGYTVYTLLNGVVEHGTYHAGQIALLKRALESSSPA